MTDRKAPPSDPHQLLASAAARGERAKAALRALAGNFRQWLLDDIAKLEAARSRLRAEGSSPETVGQLYMRAHDLKGLGATCEFPIVSRLATSLCALIDDEERPFEDQLGLVDDHIDAMRIVVERGIQSEEHPAGARLVADIERDLAYRD